MKQGMSPVEWLSGRRLAIPSKLLGGSCKVNRYLNSSVGIRPHFGNLDAPIWAISMSFHNLSTTLSLPKASDIDTDRS